MLYNGDFKKFTRDISMTVDFNINFCFEFSFKMGRIVFVALLIQFIYVTNQGKKYTTPTNEI